MNNIDKDKLNKLNDLFENEIKNERLLGCSYALGFKDKVIATGAFGSDSLDSVYKIYSMTKPITAVAALRLYEMGAFDMFEPVSNYIPAFADVKVAKGEGMDETLTDPSRPILIRDLFNMTSGLVYPGEWSYAEKCMSAIGDDLHKRAVSGEKMSNLDIISEWAKAPLRNDPGEVWLYGTSADVLAGIVEVISGMPYGEYLKKYIFDPLDMKDTAFFVPEANKDRLATMYYIDDETHVLRKATDKEKEWLNEYAPFKAPYIESGGGGLYSTLDDYMHFARMLSEGGIYENKRILSPCTVEFMGSNQLTPKQVESIYFEDLMGYGYGNLCRQLIDPAAQATNSKAGEFGWDGLAGTYFFVDPNTGLYYVFMQQIAQGGNKKLRRAMKQIIYGSIC